MEKNGTGHVTNDYWKSVDVGSRTYLDNLQTLFTDYQDRFDIDYWKLDGFALRPSKDKDNNHMVGGDHDMYFTSDLWEGWIQTFEKMRKERTDKEKDLFLNLTSYVNPSPWLLQWGNTVWLQDSGDIGFLDDFGGSQADQVISYRDNVYFNIFKKNDLQFPLKNVYNHDPIYGVSANVKFSDDDFRNYLMMNAARGTAFWELYFSPSIMNEEKWKITADVLDWAESNSKVLEHAKLFGERPDKGGVYGYSSWSDGEGIVSFRNAGDKKQSYELTLDDVAGVPAKLKNAKMVQIQPRVDETNAETKNYGDKVKVTLDPHESRIYQFTTEDKKQPKVISVKSIGKDQVRVKFDQRIQNPSFKVNGKNADAEVLEDYRTVDITASELFTKENSLKMRAENIWGDAVSADKQFTHYEDGTAAALFDKDDLVNADDMKKVHFDEPDIDLYHVDHKAYTFADQTPLTGKNDFTLSLKMRGSSAEQIILQQKDAFALAVDDKGYLNFTVGDNTISSKNTVTTVKEMAYGTFGTKDYKPTTIKETAKGKVNDGNLHDIKAVREANGMLKLYVDGELATSKYVKEKFPLVKGDITLGSTKTDIQVAEVEVKNQAIAYDEAEKSYDELNLEEGYKAMDRAGFKAYANSEEKQAEPYEGPAENVLDGKESTWWHTQYNGQRPEVPHWITIEMPEAKPVDAYEYVSRNGNGDVKKYKLQVSDTNEDNSWKTIKSGDMKNGGNTIIAFDEPVKARFYRLYITETYGTPENTFASAAEIKLHTKQQGTSDFASLAPAYEEISLMDEARYTKESLEKSGFNALKDKVKKLYLDPNAAQRDIDAAVSDFKQHYEGILEQLVEKSDGDDTIPPEISVEMNGNKLTDQAVIADSEIATFTWTAADEGSGVEKVSAAFDGEPYQRGKNIDLAGKTGAHELVVTAEDKAGNVQKETYTIRVTTSGSDMMTLVDRFEKDGAFEKAEAAHQLKIQLTTIAHFEKKESDKKVLKHLTGLQSLLKHLKKNELIPKKNLSHFKG
ncbi:discoidin domain-containing protein [Virgibacillus halophilus]|uniref:Discoidin domain-containing protein n=1 Tax=Tigheibacillus halophilus TaxID=361280 RepID=A0ABU5C470_9BACI|nr:discoidin domain-containing protein [Virgibacillus halophilus]